MTINDRINIYAEINMNNNSLIFNNSGTKYYYIYGNDT
jgi:hypothetical protein